MYVGEAPRAEFPVAKSVNCTGRDNSFVSRIAHALDVLVRVRRISDQRQFHGRGCLLESLAHFKSAVFRLHAADIEEILFGLEAQPIQHFPRGCAQNLGAIRNEQRILPVVLFVIRSNRFGIRDEPVRQDGGKILRGMKPGPRQRVPFAPFALDAIHIQGHRDACYARQNRKQRIARIAVKRRVDAVRQQMQRRNESVGQSVEIFVVNSGQVDQVHAAIHPGAMPFAAVDNYVVAALDQADGQLLRERFESAIVCRNSARPENRDAQRINVGLL